jgi:hypothetical protein
MDISYPLPKAEYMFRRLPPIDVVIYIRENGQNILSFKLLDNHRNYEEYIKRLSAENPELTVVASHFEACGNIVSFWECSYVAGVYMEDFVEMVN